MVSVICSYLEIPLLRCFEILVSLRNTIYFRETTVESESLKKWQLHFLKSPSEILKDNQGNVRGVKLQLNKLVEVRKLSKIVNYSPVSRLGPHLFQCSMCCKITRDIKISGSICTK